jgi:sugar phosphate isomerase/epimerase
MDEKRDITRRRFLAVSGGTIVGAGALSGLAHGADTGTPSKNLVTVRDSHLGETGEKDAWSALKVIGAQGVEVNIGRNLACAGLFGADKPYGIATDDEARRLADDAQNNGTPVTSFCMANQFDSRPDEEVKWVSDVAKACKRMGAGAIRIDLAPRKLKGDEYFKFIADTLKGLADLIADTGVRLGIENHGGTTNRTEFLDKLFDAVNSDRIGLTLDTGNFYWFGYPLDELYGIYKKFAPRAYHTHCKSIAYPKDQQNAKRAMGWEYGQYNCPVYEGDIDFKRVVAILKEANYRGDLCIEDESLGKSAKEKRRDVLAKEVAFLKELA